MTNAAFFDLDNTLINGSSLFHLGTARQRVGGAMMHFPHTMER
jgi:FMN phosphatase YigB (HAD superfamily)